MPFEIDYSSDPTRSAGTRGTRRSPRPTGRGHVPFLLAAYDGDGRSPEMHWRYRDLGGKAGHPSEPNPYSEVSA